MLSLLAPLVVSLLTAGVGPLVGLVAGAPAEGSRTIAVVRAVQGVSVWTVALAVISTPDFWVSVLPPLQAFVAENWSGTMAGGLVGLTLSIVFELLRRVTTRPVPRS